MKVNEHRTELQVISREQAVDFVNDRSNPADVRYQMMTVVQQYDRIEKEHEPICIVIDYSGAVRLWRESEL